MHCNNKGLPGEEPMRLKVVAAAFAVSAAIGLVAAPADAAPKKKVAVLDAECQKIGRDPAEIRRSQEAVLVIAPDQASLTEAVAKAYLEYLYSDEGQDIAGRNFYRPRNEAIAAKYAAVFPKLELITIDDVFGGWTKAQKTHFADGGVFDQIYAK